MNQEDNDDDDDDDDDTEADDANDDDDQPVIGECKERPCSPARVHTRSHSFTPGLREMFTHGLQRFVALGCVLQRRSCQWAGEVL